MNTKINFLFIFLLCSICITTVVRSWPRLGYGASPVFINNGTTARGLSVSISSTSVSRIYASSVTDREVMIQNTSTAFVVWIGTFSGITASSGPRFKLLQNFNFTTNATVDLYAIADAGSPAIEITGWVENDPKD